MMVIGITIADLNVKQSQPVGNNGYQGHTPRINITRSNCDIPKQVLDISPEVITGRFTYKLLLQFFSPAGFWRITNNLNPSLQRVDYSRFVFL